MAGLVLGPRAKCERAVGVDLCLRRVDGQQGNEFPRFLLVAAGHVQHGCTAVLVPEAALSPFLSQLSQDAAQLRDLGRRVVPWRRAEVFAVLHRQSVDDLPGAAVGNATPLKHGAHARGVARREADAVVGDATLHIPGDPRPDLVGVAANLHAAVLEDAHLEVADGVRAAALAKLRIGLTSALAEAGLVCADLLDVDAVELSPVFGDAVRVHTDTLGRLDVGLGGDLAEALKVGDVLAAAALGEAGDDAVERLDQGADDARELVVADALVELGEELVQKARIGRLALQHLHCQLFKLLSLRQLAVVVEVLDEPLSRFWRGDGQYAVKELVLDVLRQAVPDLVERPGDRRQVAVDVDVDAVVDVDRVECSPAVKVADKGNGGAEEASHCDGKARTL